MELFHDKNKRPTIIGYGNQIPISKLKNNKKQQQSKIRKHYIVFYYFCFSRNIIEISKFLLFFSTILGTILNNSDI